MPRVVRRCDRCLQRGRHRFEPRRSVEAEGVGDTPVFAGAECAQCVIDVLQLRGHPHRRRIAALGRARHEAPHTIDRAAAPFPGCAALRNPLDQRLRRGQRRRDAIAPDNRVLERLQGRDVANADVTITGPGRRQRVRLPGGRSDHQQHAEQHREDRRARRDRELQQRRAPARAITHECPHAAR